MKSEPKIFELKVLKEFDMKNVNDDDLNKAIGKRDLFSDEPDEFGGLDSLRLEDGFS
jgi:hypothetical protein